MRKPDFVDAKTKAQISFAVIAELPLHGFFLKSEISSFYPSSEAAQTGLCQTWSETPKTGFLASRLNFDISLR